MLCIASDRNHAEAAPGLHKGCGQNCNVELGGQRTGGQHQRQAGKLHLQQGIWAAGSRTALNFTAVQQRPSAGGPAR